MRPTALMLVVSLTALPASAQAIYTTVNLTVYGTTSLNSGGTAKYTN